MAKVFKYKFSMYVVTLKSYVNNRQYLVHSNIKSYRVKENGMFLISNTVDNDIAITSSNFEYMETVHS